MTDNDITGRDSYILAQALAYAIETIGALPEHRRQISNQSDMKKLLDHIVANDQELEIVISDVKRHMAR